MFQRNTQNHEIMVGGACHMGQLLLGGHGGPPHQYIDFQSSFSGQEFGNQMK